MVKNIPTIERSTKIRFGKHATDDQAENTIVFNASNVAIDASTAGGVYITPMRTVDPSVPEITVLSYNTVTKEIVNSNTASADLFNANLQFVSQRGNVTSNTLEFINPTTAFITTGNVGIQNTSPTHALDIGSDFHVTQGGEVRIGPSVLIDSSVTNQIQVAGRIDTDSITLDHIGLSNNNPTITGLSLGSSTFLQHPTDSINAFSTTGNVSAAFYHGDSYYLSNLTLDNIITQGNTAASKTVEFNTPVTAFITNSNVGILNTSPIHTLDVGSNLFIDDKGSNILVVTGNTYTSRKALVGSNVTIDTLGSNVVEVTGNTFTSRKALVGSNLVMDTLGSNVVEVTGNTFTSRKASIGSNLVMDTLGSNVVEVTGNTFTSRKALIGSNVTIDTLGSNVVEVTGNTYTSRKVLVGSNVTIDTLGSNVVEVTGNTYTSRKALVGSNVTIDTLGSNVVEVTGNTFTSRKALVGSNLVMDTLGSNVVEVTGNVNVSNYTKTDYITVQKDAHIKGNLLVEGTTTTIDTTNTTFEDAIISLANNNQISTTDIGIIMKQPNDDASPTITFRGDEKEMMVGYTLNNSLDTEVTPDLANVIDLHVYGNVIVQNNLTLTSGNITTVTVNSNVFGDNVVATNTMYGNISGSNLISASNITVGNLFTNSNIYGNIAGSNLISASNITVGNLFTNSNIYGNIAGSNLISASNITVGNLFTNSNIYGNIAGSNLISASNVTTGILHVESNVITDNVESTTMKISGLTSGFVPIVGSDNILEDSVIEYSGDTTTISSNVEITGNLSVLGNTFTIESNSLVINDRVLGIANNNVSHSLDVGIIMGHPEHNIAFIHHGEPDGQDTYEHELVLGYTDNVVTDNHVLYTDANLITFRVLGNVIVQNNLTLTSGDLTAITVNSNVVGDNVSVITLNGNVVGENVSVTTVYGNVIGDGVITTNMFGTIAGANTINASTISALTINSNVVADNVVATDMYGQITGANTINASTISALTINSNVVADNVVATNGIYGAIAGQNTVTASTIYVGTGSPTLGDWELRVDGDTEIMGNLRVAGTTTTVDTQNLVVKDPIIQLGDASSSVDSGLLLARPSSTDNVYVGYDQNRTEFAIGFTDNHAGDSDITIKQGEDFTLNVYGNVEANYLFGNGSQLTGIQTATPNLHDIVNVDNVTSNVVQFSNATTGIKIASNIAFDDKITLKSLTSGSKNGFFVIDTIQLDPGPSSSPTTVPAAMTANSSGGNTASSGNGALDTYEAFDGSDSTHYTSPPNYGTSSKSGYAAYTTANSLGGVYGEWIKLQLSSAITPTSVFLKSRPDGTDSAGRPASWRILGSNDDTNWTQLHSSTTVVDDSSGTTESFTNTTAYSYLAFQVTHLNSNYGKWTLSRLSYTDPSTLSPLNNVLSYNTITGEIYDSGGQGGSSFDNITEQDANVFIGSNLIINTYGSNVLTVGGNISANNITLGELTIAASPFGLDDIVSSASGSNVTSNVLQIEGIESNVITANTITVSGNTTSQNIKLTNTDISASIASGTITVDAKEKTYGTAPLVVSTTDVSNLVFSNLITGAQIVIPILADGGAINISSTMTNVNFYAMTSDVSVAQDKHALMTLSNLYGNIYMNAIGFS